MVDWSASDAAVVADDGHIGAFERYCSIVRSSVEPTFHAVFWPL